MKISSVDLSSALIKKVVGHPDLATDVHVSTIFLPPQTNRTIVLHEDELPGYTKTEQIDWQNKEKWKVIFKED